MIRLKTFETLGECDRAKSLLEAHGINCEIKNEFAANTAGAGIRGSLPFARPELWIRDERKRHEAIAILSGKEK